MATALSALPETRYARSGEVSIAYQVTGAGPVDLVYVPPFITNVELQWQVPAWAALLRRLSSFSRLIRFDKRGTGMSDRVEVGDLETRMDDIRAVMDAAGSRRAAVLGCSDGGPISILFAASYPERVTALLLWGTFARLRWAYDYPEGISDEQFAHETDEEVRLWTVPGFAEEAAQELGAPEAQALATMWRHSASPGAIRVLERVNSDIDVRYALPAIDVPTLVLNRTGGYPDSVAGSRYLAEHIRGARLIEFERPEHVMFGGDFEPIVRAIETFLAESHVDRDPAGGSERVLATVLFADIVGSTARLVQIGDAAWRGLLEAFRTRVRRLLVRHGGREVDTAGDGFFASFDGPARAIRCASEITEAAVQFGLEVRVGLHAGECELIDGKVGGIAVHIGARIAEAGTAGEVLVSSTVKDLVAGSGIRFDERGERELAGVPEAWRLYSVASVEG